MLPWDGGWRLYYRAAILDLKREEDTYVLALAESRDGIVFARPELGVCEFEASRRNNILQIGGFPNVPPPFLDTNPACAPAQRFKGITGRAAKAYAMASPDGIRWTPLQPAPLELSGQFDTAIRCQAWAWMTWRPGSETPSTCRSPGRTAATSHALPASPSACASQ